jgi:hypothetical protein
MAEAQPTLPFRRERRRRDAFRELNDEKKQKIAERVINFFNDDDAARSDERDQLLQRYAKYRQWVSNLDIGPWPGSSDQRVPDMAEAALRTQDTLHNAAMTTRPMVASMATHRSDKDKQEVVDDLHDVQFFVEQDGEKVVEEAAEEFTIKPECVIFVPWIKEMRRTVDTLYREPLPKDAIPPTVFDALLKEEWPDATYRQTDDEGWDWEVKPKGRKDYSITVKFYANKKETEMVVIDNEVLVYEGPRAIVKDYDDVFAPTGCSNLQIPGPSNPGGATHVILRDSPTQDEIARLQADGTYNLITTAEVEALEARTEKEDQKEEKDQKQTLAGKQKDPKPRDAKHGKLTRLMCFDVYDMDGDGVAEDMIFWVLLEPKLLLKVKPLAEMYPFDRPMRPLAEASYLPVKGCREGVSLLELCEGLHDFRKEMIDHLVDCGHLTTTPSGLYRASSTINPEKLRLGPGDLAPAADPQRDIRWNEIRNDAMPFALNTLAFIQQEWERLTLQGDLQAGRVPAGKSSALRTLGGVQTILAQGEARPERVLRRFFMLWVQVWKIMYQLNKRRLPAGKEFKIAGFVEPDKDPFRTIESRSEIDGTFDFYFRANVFNASKGAALQSLQEFGAVAITPLSIQMGTVTGEGLFRYQRDLGKALGMNPDNYLNPPMRPRISFEDVVDTIMQGGIPNGWPMEGANAQFARLKEFIASEEFGYLTSDNVRVLGEYMNMLAQLARNESMMAQQVQAAAEKGAGGGNSGTPPQQQNPSEPTMLGPGELADESIERQGQGRI